MNVFVKKKNNCAILIFVFWNIPSHSICCCYKISMCWIKQKMFWFKRKLKQSEFYEWDLCRLDCSLLQNKESQPALFLKQAFLNLKNQIFLKKGHQGQGPWSTKVTKVEKNLAGENFFIWFLAKLDNSKLFGKKKFFGLFWPFEAFKGHKGQNFA